jgi:hypothetical protein
MVTKKRVMKKVKKKVMKRKVKNPWIIHVLKEKKKYPNKKYCEILTLAKKTYKKK